MMVKVLQFKKKKLIDVAACTTVFLTVLLMSSLSSRSKETIITSAVFNDMPEVVFAQSKLSSCAEAQEHKHLGGKTQAAVAGVQFDMFVYASGGIRDIVSDSIARSKSWEGIETTKLMSLLPCDDGLGGGMKTVCDEDAKSRGVLLDVGANIGWFSLVALHLGHDVIAFEPFQNNVDILCNSILEYTSWTEKRRFHLNQLGLDFKRRQCELFQVKNINIGDTHSVCDKKTRDKMLGNKYESLGWMNTTTLDDALFSGTFSSVDHIDVMKIDVEGFESAVIFGGNKFFESKYAPSYVYMEMVSSFMDTVTGSENKGNDFFRAILLHMHNHGYELEPLSKNDSGQELSLHKNSFEEIQRVYDGKNVLFVRIKNIS